MSRRGMKGIGVLLAVLLFLVCVVAYVWLMRERLKVLMEENERISVELANAMAGNVLVRDTIRDSVQVVSAPVVVVGSKSYKKEVADKELMKDLGLKPPQVEEQQTTVTVIHDTVTMRLAPDSASFVYSDYWADFRLTVSPSDTTLAYSVRDSVSTIVHRDYKHRFLWWRWGTKGYRVKVINYNPHARLLYEQYVRVRKR